MGGRVCPCVLTIRTVHSSVGERAEHAPSQAYLSPKLSDIFRAVLVRAYEASVRTFGDLAIRLRDRLGAARRGRCLRFMTGKIRDIHSIVRSCIQVGWVIRVLGERRRWRGISRVLFLVHIVLFLLQHIHLRRVCGLRHEGRTGLVGERHVVGICVGWIPGAIGNEVLRLLRWMVARDVAMLMMLCKAARGDRV